jgi:hypothetical protein
MSTLPSSIPNAMYMTPYANRKPWDISSYQFFLDLGYKLTYFDDEMKLPFLQWREKLISPLDRDIDDLTEAAMSHLWAYEKVMDELVVSVPYFMHKGNTLSLLFLGMEYDSDWSSSDWSSSDE